MALDTRNKRAAALGYGLSFLVVLPQADGAISVEDAGHALSAYAYDIAQPQPSPTPVQPTAQDERPTGSAVGRGRRFVFADQFIVREITGSAYGTVRIRARVSARGFVVYETSGVATVTLPRLTAQADGIVSAFVQSQSADASFAITSTISASGSVLALASGDVVTTIGSSIGIMSSGIVELCERHIRVEERMRADEDLVVMLEALWP